MPFSPVPTDWIPAWSEDGSDITFPIASLPQLTAAEADAASGDIRDIAYAFIHNLHQKWTALDAADRPSKMTIASQGNIDPASGQVTRQYTFVFILDGSYDVAAEE